MQEQHAAPGVLLAAIPLFTRLAPKTLARIAERTIELDIDAGTQLFQRGEPCVGLYGVVSGRVKLSLPAGGSAEKVVALVGAGHTFAESAAFLDERHVLSAETLAACKLLRVHKRALRSCLREDARFAARVVQALSWRVHELIIQVENTTLLSGTQRVADFVLRELVDESTDGPATITLPAKKRIIASQLDLTQEHFSRILHELVAANLLIVRGSSLTVPNAARLRAYRDESRQSRRAKMRGGPGRDPLPDSIRVA